MFPGVIQGASRFTIAVEQDIGRQGSLWFWSGNQQSHFWSLVKNTLKIDTNTFRTQGFRCLKGF